MRRTDQRPSHSSGPGRSDRNSGALNVYYCLCGEFALVVDKPLASLPLRPLDHSRILRCLDSPPYSITGAPQKVRKARVFKMSASQGQPKLVQRPDETIEKQFPFHCSRCQLQIGYEHTPPPLKSGAKFTFVLPGALTDRQGVPPPDAFLQDLLAESDDPVPDEAAPEPEAEPAAV